jgi:hypothetical protein
MSLASQLLTRLTEHIIRIGRKECKEIFVRKSLGEYPLGRLRKWECTIKTNLWKTGCEDRRYITWLKIMPNNSFEASASINTMLAIFIKSR